MRKFTALLFFLFLIGRLFGQTINYTYDNLGRLTQTVYPDSSIINYTYDASGNRITTLSKISPAADASLINLILGKGTLSPVFAGTITGYTATEANNITSVTVTPTTNNAGATVKINGTSVASGIASAPVALNVGMNAITIIVTARDGVTTQTYTVTVTRAPSNDAYLGNLTVNGATLAPSFNFKTLSYSSTVSSATTSVTVKPLGLDPTATIKVNGTTVASKTNSQPIPLTVGANTIHVVVTAQDGTTTQAYTITITRLSNNAYLANLSVSSGAFTSVFASNVTNYTDTVSHVTTSMTITPTTSDPNATVTVNGVAVTSGTASGMLPLNIGNNLVTIKVTAQDGVTTDTYTLNAVREGSHAAGLANLSVSSTPISPAFATATLSYNATVTSGTQSVTVTPSVIDPTSTVTVNGHPVANKTASGAIALKVGSNTITVIVTAQDGMTTRTYTIKVARPSNDAYLAYMSLQTVTLSPAFVYTTLSYTSSVPNSTSSVRITFTLFDTTARAKVNGTAVANKTASGPIALAVGSNTINVVVTAQDGVTTKTYTIKVTRLSNDAYLAYMSVQTATLSPAFAYTTLSYTSSVPNSTSSVRITFTLFDTTARAKVNGTAVANKTPSGPIALNAGSNTINVVVTAQDGVTTKTYTITITRAPSANAGLSAMKISSGTLTPAFATGTASYTASVSNATATITLTPTTADPTATVKVNGTAVISGTASAAIPLKVGSNTITTIVTAQDGVTTKTYILTVARPSNDAYLAYMSVQTATLSPAFTYTTLSYTSSVPNSTSSVKVTFTLFDTTARAKVNGAAVANKTASGAIALAVGSNTITILVTAQDGVTTQTYAVTITRAAAPVDGFDPGLSVNNPAEHPSFSDDIIVVHNGISPNGDGINDFLVIDGILAYPENKLSIMNRNGQLIYEAQGYDNSSKVFDGHSNKNGQMQLPGTYFYQLDYTVNGTTKRKTGFIVLKY